MNPKESIFMKILSGDIPCHKVYEDGCALAFLDVYPHAKGHTLVIPKQPVYTFDEVTDVAGLFTAVQKTMNVLKQKLNCDGFNVGWNNGKVAGQAVPYMHVHIMPRYEDDNGGSMHTIINNPGPDTVDNVAKLFQ